MARKPITDVELAYELYEEIGHLADAAIANGPGDSGTYGRSFGAAGYGAISDAVARYSFEERERYGITFESVLNELLTIARERANYRSAR